MQPEREPDEAPAPSDTPSVTTPARWAAFPFDVIVFAAAVALMIYAHGAAPPVDCDAESGPDPSVAYQAAKALGAIGVVAAAFLAALLPRSAGAKVAGMVGYLVGGGVLYLVLVASYDLTGLC